VFSKNVILIYLIVFYCVKVGGNNEATHQRSKINRNNGEKVLENIVFYNLNHTIWLKKREYDNNKNGKTSKFKKKRRGRKGRTIFLTKTKYSPYWKRHIFKKRKSSNKSPITKPIKCMKKIVNICVFYFNFYLSQFKSCKTLFISKMYDQNSCKPKQGTQYNKKGRSWYASDKCVRRKTISKILQMGNVEINPGPNNNLNNNKSMDIMTYNCNGLASRDKRNRVLNKVNKITNKGGIVMLQETHIMDSSQISSSFKGKFLLNQYKSNAAGVAIFLGNEYEIIYSFSDKIGRFLIAVVVREEEKFLLINVYCPNDHKLSIDFIENVYLKLLETNNDHPDCHIVLAGDFNCCISENDLRNRNRTKSEVELSNMIQQNNLMCSLVDSYRKLHPEEGYTWNRGLCYSRLDCIYVSQSIEARIKSSSLNWAFDKSDHAAVISSIRLKSEIRKGPGITKVNTDVLKNPNTVAQIRDEIIFLLNQIPTDWNGHVKLEYLKMIIRSTMAKYMGIDRAGDKIEIESLELSLNDIEVLKLKIIKNRENLETDEFMNKLNKTENIKQGIKNSLETLRNKESKQIEFSKIAKWYEYGEKPNKFFLNLLDFRSKQKIIDQIKDGQEKYVGHDEVMGGIRKFYQDLYAEQKPDTKNKVDINFFDSCPKLSDNDKDNMDKEITLEEMYKALKTCKDSAPGPDGIPYSVYKTFWPQIGSIIKESWDYSIKMGIIPNSHKESIITILPKEGKDLSDIKNWRPITLTNCDAKIITKALAIRVNKVLESIIDTSQTAYIPGRSVMDNLRGNKFMKDYCKQHNIDAVLVSLDAKKAFDSVNHEYIDTVLVNYGFGEVFRHYFKTLYKDLSAKILINGYLSKKISIERGVKQGDALSCAIFILCIDPLIRNINKNK